MIFYSLIDERQQVGKFFQATSDPGGLDTGGDCRKLPGLIATGKKIKWFWTLVLGALCWSEDGS